ncbi:sulfatase family protein [Bacillus niameyensis]|uniref:sulfatase family protein n=1 Tax=Bacillus niameyensis TaxID=1522308 RepID=UPI000781FADF|nr:arylsulfatase [Bacillus niameyensis]
MKPNIIYILTDDFGYGDSSCYGATKINTPNIDRLASEGVLFTNAHSPSAVCTPTRYSILTGRYCWRSRLKKGVLVGDSNPLIEKDRTTVPSYLKQNGYKTSCIGKWHLGLEWSKDGDEINFEEPIKHGPLQVGFDYYYGISASLDMPPYCFIENDRSVGIPSIEKYPMDFSQRGRGGLMTPGWEDKKVNKVHTQKATEWIKRHIEKSSEQPFFMYLALTGPHTPWTPDDEFIDKSGIGPRGDLILEMDWTVGEVMKTLERLGIRENTLLIFTSDNGPHPKTEEITKYGHKPVRELRGQKADIWDGGHKVPFIASWPQYIKPGSISSELICLTDLMSTCAEMLGETLPKDIGEDSFNILPALLGEQSQPIRESIVHHSYSGMFSFRKGEWKLIVGEGSGGFGIPDEPQIIGIPLQGGYKQDGKPCQLYNIKNDPEEEYNLYTERNEIAKELERELQEITQSGYSRTS